MSNGFETVIGKHINSESAKSFDWSELWPEVDESGIITGVFGAGEIEDGAVLVNWSSARDGKGHPVPTDGSNGFEAVLA